MGLAEERGVEHHIGVEGNEVRGWFCVRRRIQGERMQGGEVEGVMTWPEKKSNQLNGKIPRAFETPT